MSGIKPKPFEMWVKRCHINVKRWAEQNEIQTLEELGQICALRNLAFPISPAILSIFSGPTTAQDIEPSKLRGNAKKKKVKSNPKEVWHTPAAERPLHRTKKKKKS